MANLLFKKGLYSDFQKNVITGNKAVEGAFYVTEDEGGLYLGQSGGGVKRIQGSVLFFESLTQFTSKVAPPYSTDVIYFVANENALIRWDGAHWIQLNATADDVTNKLNALRTDLDGEVNRAKAKENELDAAIKTEASRAQGEESKLDTAIKTEAETARKAESANAAAAKRAQEAATAAQGTADTAVANAATAQDAADAAQSVADNAMAEAKKRVLSTDFEAFKTTNTAAIADAKKAGTDAATAAAAAQKTADSKTTMAEVEKKGYATTGYVDSAKSGLLGTTEDAATANTIYGAKAAAKAAQDKANANATAIDAANKKISANEANISSLSGSLDSAKNELNTAINNEATTARAAEKKLTDDLAKEVARSTDKDTAHETRMGQIEASVAAVKTTADGALQRAGGTMTGMLVLAAAPAADMQAANKKYVDDKIGSAIAANDAMTFKGVLGSEGLKALPTTGVQRGDTYKVGVAGTYANVAAKVGDLFINTGEDNKTPVWEHITSGYEDDYQQSVIAANGGYGLNDGVNNTISKGGLKFVSSSANISLVSSTSADANGLYAVTANLVWDTF